MAALRCGHLFGVTCIRRWLTSQRSAAKCPQVGGARAVSAFDAIYLPFRRLAQRWPINVLQEYYGLVMCTILTFEL